MSVPDQMPLAEVKNRLSEVVDRLEREHGHVIITKHGRPAAVVISVEDLQSLEETLDIMNSAALLGLGTGWVPRELRHTFVSLLSAHGVPVEAIALLAGHNQTATTELVYRHQIVPALTRGAEVMDQIFG
jgi:prevent-host-death family protein